MGRRRNIYMKTQGRCAYCGIGLEPIDGWETEHMTPKSQGGTNNIKNLVASCRSCNSRKWNRTVDQFREAIVDMTASVIEDAVMRLSDAFAGHSEEVRDWCMDAFMLLDRLEDELRFPFYMETTGRGDER